MTHQKGSRPPASSLQIFKRDRVLSYLLGVLARLLLTFRRKRKLPPDALGAAQSFLFIRPEGLGDIILTLPAIAYIREKNPGARLAMAVRPMFARMVSDMGVVHEVISLDYPKKSTLTLRQMRPFWRRVWPMRQRFDIAFDFRGDARNALIGAWSARMVVGPAAPGTEFLLSSSYRDTRPLPMAERNLGVVSLGQAERPAIGDYASAFRYRMDGDAQRRSSLLLQFKESYILVHPGASRPSNRWEPNRWRELIRRFLEAGEQVVITGAGKEDFALAAEIQEGLEPRAGLASLVNRTNCEDLTAIVQKAQVVISPDTGVAHIAFAHDVPSVTLFGSDSEFLWGHESPSHAVICVRLWCRPCGAYRCPRSDHPMECLDSIGSEPVWLAARAAVQASMQVKPVGLEENIS